jgi:DNA polymerase-3 subunit delta
MAKTNGLTPRAFIKAAAQKTFGGTFLLYGHDEYIKKETMRLAIRAYLGDGQTEFGVTHLVAGQTDAQEILACADSVPMLGTRAVVVVHDIQKLAVAHKTRLTKSWDQLSSSNLLILAGPAEPDLRTKFYKWFIDAGQYIACEPLSPPQAETFARKRMAEHESSISDRALAHLLTLTGPEAGVIAREAEKLALYVGKGNNVDVEAVDTVAGHSAGCTAEDLVSALLEGDRSRSLNISRRLQESGMDSTSVIGRLAMHFYDLQRAAHAGTTQSWRLASALRLPRSRAEQLSHWLRGASGNRIESALEHLARADRLVRSGQTDPSAVCDQLVLTLAGAAKGTMAEARA